MTISRMTSTFTGRVTGCRIVPAVLLCGLVAVQFATIPAAQAAGLTIDRITALPSLDGTPPANPVWSPDSRRVAFLWNDRGGSFRDLWLVDAAGTAPRRLTDLADRIRSMAAANPVTGEAGTGGRIDPRLVADAATRAHRGISEMVWSANGEALFFNLQGQIFRIGADGSKPERLTAEPAMRRSIALSPDGRILSFLQGGELWFLRMDTGELSQMTHAAVPDKAPRATPQAEFVSYRWSPDGRYVALSLMDRRRTRTLLIPEYLGEETSITTIRRGYPGDTDDEMQSLLLYEADRGNLLPVPIDSAHRQIDDYAWSPDGHHLLVDQSSFDGVDRWIYLVVPGGVKARELWHDARATRTAPLWDSAWRSDGRGILFISNVDGWYHLHALPVNGGPARLLTPGDYSLVADAGPVRLSATSATREVFFVSTQKNPHERQVYRMPDTGGPVTQVTTLPGVHLPAVAPDGTTLAVLHSSDVAPTELYLVDLRKPSQERRITRSPPREFDAHPWVAPRYVTFSSRVDGATLHGRLIEPRDLEPGRKYPVIVGPVYRDTVRQKWRPRHSLLEQYLVLEGRYICFNVDVRGSTAYGRDFEEGVLKRYGDIDVEDLLSGVEYLRTLPYVDADRIGIWGHSYGGLVALASVFRKPGVYRAAVAGAPAVNAWHMPTSITTRARDPASAAESYRAGSPITHGEALRDHLMIIQGVRDPGNLFKDSLMLAEKLMLLGKDFDLVVVPGAEHEWFRQDYQARYTFTKLIGHFDRYLGRGP